MKYPDIAEEIIEMSKEDRRVREEFYGQSNPNHRVYAEFVQPVDEKNHQRMVEIVERIGYPTISKVGKEASFETWLIIQHYSRDDFQKKCLKLMEEDPSDVDPQNIAYLKDRILAFAGKKQIYGTQWRENPETKKLELFEVEDPENLNKRRSIVGLKPIDENV